MTNSEMISHNATLTNAPSDSYTRLRGRRLPITRVAWLAVVSATVALYVVSIPVQAQMLSMPCTDNCQNGQINAAQMQELSRLGLSLNFYVGYFTGLQAVFGFVFLVIGALIFWRKSDDWMALLVSLMLVIFGLATVNSTPGLAALAYPSFTFPGLVLQFLGAALLVFFFFLFPDGRFVPRWMRWLVPFILIRNGVNVFLPYSELGSGVSGTVLLFIELALVLYSQIYRYRRVSGPVQRQQTKWVVYGLTIWVIGLLGVTLFFNFVSQTGPSVIASLVVATLGYMTFMAIPVSLLIAILRYRLYDIEILINRTLVYVPLTSILAGTFAASITLSQNIFVAVTGEKSDTATVLTTLLVVAAFEPLKTGLQHVVDKRFKEVRDPNKELHAFGDQVRAVVQVLPVEQLAQRLADTATRAFNDQGGAVILGDGVNPRMAYASKDWNGETQLSVPLEIDGKTLGQLKLGARRNGTDYTERDREMLRHIAGIVGQALEQDDARGRDAMA
jgi:hypothetical protein